MRLIGLVLIPLAVTLAAPSARLGRPGTGSGTGSSTLDARDNHQLSFTSTQADISSYAGWEDPRNNGGAILNVSGPEFSFVAIVRGHLPGPEASHPQANPSITRAGGLTHPSGKPARNILGCNRRGKQTHNAIYQGKPLILTPQTPSGSPST